MQPNIEAYNYPVQNDKQNEPIGQQPYQQQNQIYQGQGVPLGYPMNHKILNDPLKIEGLQDSIFNFLQKQIQSITKQFIQKCFKQQGHQKKVKSFFKLIKQLDSQFDNTLQFNNNNNHLQMVLQQFNLLLYSGISDIKTKKPTIQQVRRVNADDCSYPADILCPYCQKPVQTFIKHKSGCHTLLACWLLFLFFLPLFFLPFCFEECQDKIHYCPNCGRKVGKKKYKMCC